MSDQALLERPVPINLAQITVPSRCAHCEARRVGLCHVLGDDDLHYLASAGTFSAVAKTTRFVVEGDAATALFNLNHGHAKLFKELTDGRRQIIGFVGAGDFVGLAADTHYNFSAEAIDEVHLCRFDRAALHRTSLRFPAIEQQLLAVATHELVIAHDQMLLLGRKTAIERVASFLTTWQCRADGHCTHGDAPVVLDLPMTRTDLADYLGLTTETVSRALSTLRDRQIIGIRPDHAIIIRQPDQLAKIAHIEQ